MCQNLIYNELHVENRANGESIIIIPIDNTFITHLNLCNSYLKIPEDSILDLMIIQSMAGKLRWSSIVSFHSYDVMERNRLLDKTIQNILNQGHVEETGMFKFVDLKGRLWDQLEFKKGSMSSLGSIVTGDYLPKKRRYKLGLTDVDESSKYYLITTYHNCDAGRPFSEEYLYTSNDSDITEFGYGEPEEENDMEFEFSEEIETISEYSSFDEYRINHIDIQITFYNVQPDERELILSEINAILTKCLGKQQSIIFRSFSGNRLSFYLPSENKSALEKFTEELMTADLDITSISSSGPSTMLSAINSDKEGLE